MFLFFVDLLYIRYKKPMSCVSVYVNEPNSNKLVHSRFFSSGHAQRILLAFSDVLCPSLKFSIFFLGTDCVLLMVVQVSLHMSYQTKTL